LSAFRAKLGDAIDNAATPPLTFKMSDLKLHLAEGEFACYREKIKISGIRYLPSCMANVEFKCGLSNPFFEA
jgi:hypothetical protein